MEEIWKFYCVHYLYSFSMMESDFTVCYQAPALIQKLRTTPGQIATERFQDFLGEWSQERHQEILQNVESSIKKLHLYRDDVFLRKDGSVSG